jgi:hypothetical protein
MKSHTIPGRRSRFTANMLPFRKNRRFFAYSLSKPKIFAPFPPNRVYYDFDDFLRGQLFWISILALARVVPRGVREKLKQL